MYVQSLCVFPRILHEFPWILYVCSGFGAHFHRFGEFACISLGFVRISMDFVRISIDVVCICKDFVCSSMGLCVAFPYMLCVLPRIL